MTPEARARFGARSPRCCGTHWRRVEAAGAERLAVDHRVGVAGGADRGDDLRLALRARGRGRRRRPRAGPRMPWWRTRRTGKPSARTARSARSMRRERLRVDRGAVGDARREARRGRLLGAREAELAGERAHLRPCRRRRAAGGTTPCSAAALQAGAPVARRRRRWRPRAARRSRGAGELGEHVVELGLAEVAAVGAVARGSRRGRARRCATISCAMPIVRGDAPRAVELAGGHRGRDGGHGERAVAERACGERGDERRVDAAGERDDRRCRAAATLRSSSASSVMRPPRARPRAPAPRRSSPARR